MEGTMVEEIEVSKTMEKHLEAIDIQLSLMMDARFNHESLHNFRESIRQFRALMFFYMPNIRPSDYRMVESLSKKYFNMTSVIREIDVFENGYQSFMNDGTIQKLTAIKQPLIDKLKSEIDETNGFKFQQIKIHIRPWKAKSNVGKCILSRQCELFQTFLEKDVENFNDEKYIHAKRMLAKKLCYIHDILTPEVTSLARVRLELEQFQQAAKQLHDVCVNLRYVGQYQLDDSKLIEKLVKDHEVNLKVAETQYFRTCEAINEFLSNPNA